MSPNNKETIFPCPFSPSYGIPEDQAWSLLKIFLTYRFILACLFISMLYGLIDSSALDFTFNQIYIYSSQSYLLLTIFSGILVIWRFAPYAWHSQLLILTDIVILTLLMHACGGVKSGIGILIAVSIASSGLLIGGRCAMLFAALASLAVLVEQLLFFELHGSATSSYTYAGMLGAVYLTIAFLSHFFAQRTEQAFKISQQQSKTIVKLEDLNQYIIQHLRSGIIITDEKQNIQLLNEAAMRLSYLAVDPSNLRDISINLSEAFHAWLIGKNQDAMRVEMPNQGRIYCRFTALPTHHEMLYMIIIEDTGLYKQRLQQSKLASLGRLAASIAHEIRNPLSAISHAQQLLSESPQLTAQDQRLTTIIHTHCHRVNRIIEDILLLSRRSDSRRETLLLQLWLVNYLEDFIEEHRLTADTFTLTQASDPIYINMDTGHLKQILDNLCMNAIRYGKPDSTPIIIRSVKNENTPIIEVIDNGDAISEETSKHLFEPFFTTSPSGTGLGLYISKELAELNQANLLYYLTENNHNCFQLRLLDAAKNLIEI